MPMAESDNILMCYKSACLQRLK